MENFSKYEKLRDKDMSAEAAYLSAKEDGLDTVARIRMLHLVYKLSHDGEVQEVMAVAHNLGANFSEDERKLFLEEYEKKLIRDVSQAFSEMDKEEG